MKCLAFNLISVSNTIYENVELKIVDDEKAQLEAYELILAKPTTAALTEDPKIKERENYHTFYAWLTVVGICVISIVLCLKCCCGSCLKDKTMHYWKSCKTWFAAKMKKYANVPCLPKTPSVTEPLNAAVNGEEEEMDLSFYVTSLCS